MNLFNIEREKYWSFPSSYSKEKRKIMGEAGRKKAEESFSQQIFCENWFREVTGRSRDGALL